MNDELSTGMGILIDKDTKVLVQGITGREGSFHAYHMKEYGTKVVAGVTPGKGGMEIYGVPVYDTVDEALSLHRIDASVVFVPQAYAADAVMEAADSGIGLIVCITDGIPVLDMVEVKRYLKESGKVSLLIGPNSPGIITPDECKIGIMPGTIHKKGGLGVTSRSGSLTYEAVDQLSRLGIGQSTCVGIGGDMITGSSFVDILRLFNEDDRTEAVLLIGEIGGTAEEDAALYIKTEFNKPVMAYIAGSAAPPNRRMGHAGAIVSAGKGTAQYKMDALKDAGAVIITNPAEIGEMVKELRITN